MKRPLIVAGIVIFAVGLLIGAGLHRAVTHKSLPPARLVFSVTLNSDSFADSPVMALYARDIAAHIESRFHAPPRSPWPLDLQVTADAPSCFEGRTGCGSAVAWSMHIRSKQPIDRQAVGVALGRGELTLRRVLPGSSLTCERQPYTTNVNPIMQPFIPSAVDTGCISFGPALRTLTGATAFGDAASSTTPGRVLLTTTAADDAWLANWFRSHVDAEVGVLVDGWIIGRVHASEIANLSYPSPLTSVGITSDSMVNAIDTAIMAPPLPDVGIPTTVP
ncbi:MAG: hypothetical protein QOG50_2898 [Actinomycetota bacterium]|nr:hypothetical protein [Actinomycetota bacterium]